MTTDTSPGAVTPSKPPLMWLAAGGMALVSLAAAAAMVLRPGAPEPQMVPLQAAKPEAAVLTKSGVVSGPVEKAAEKPAKGVTPQAARPNTPHAPQAPNATKAVEAKHAKAAEPVRVAAVCSYCGVVEAVSEVNRKGEGTGLGAIAGGVLGAAAGNQVGRGDGRKVMTVLGAVGGGLAGHEVEKRARGETVYQVRIRLDDGSSRTIEQTTAPKIGARIELHGNTLKSAG